MTRTLLVTGASSGIGLETTKLLLDRGHRIIGIARNLDRAKINSKNFIPVACDLADLSSLPQVLSEIGQGYPDMTGIVACAGQGRFGTIETFSYAQIKTLVDINFTSQCFIVKAFMPNLKKSERSDIIFLGSEAALEGGKQGAIYSATKFALRGFAQSLRKECAKSGVRITLINPGMVKTPFFDSLSFEPGTEEDNYIEAANVAEAILVALEMRSATVIDEINLSPLKKVIVRKPSLD